VSWGPGEGGTGADRKGLTRLDGDPVLRWGVGGLRSSLASRTGTGRERRDNELDCGERGRMKGEGTPWLRSCHAATGAPVVARPLIMTIPP